MVWGQVRQLRVQPCALLCLSGQRLSKLPYLASAGGAHATGPERGGGGLRSAGCACARARHCAAPGRRPPGAAAGAASESLRTLLRCFCRVAPTQPVAAPRCTRCARACAQSWAGACDVRLQCLLVRPAAAMRLPPVRPALQQVCPHMHSQRHAWRSDVPLHCLLAAPSQGRWLQCTCPLAARRSSRCAGTCTARDMRCAVTCPLHRHAALGMTATDWRCRRPAQAMGSCIASACKQGAGS